MGFLSGRGQVAPHVHHGEATAGAEVAERLAEEGAFVAVFEQNPRPYGKIEERLPLWHHELRRKEYRSIDAKLSHANVGFVPNTRIGRDVDFEALARSWGFHAVVLANGAWRDRPLPVTGADAYLGRGLIYQNPFIIWLNHAGEKDYRGPRFEAQDDVIVVGGGLASIDVAKVLMLESTRTKLRERGIEESVLELEVKGIPKLLERLVPPCSFDMAVPFFGLATTVLLQDGGGRNRRSIFLLQQPPGTSRRMQLDLARSTGVEGKHDRCTRSPLPR